MSKFTFSKCVFISYAFCAGYLCIVQAQKPGYEGFDGFAIVLVGIVFLAVAIYNYKN